MRALRWHGRLELEAPTLTLAESQFALAALAALRGGNRDAIGVLRRLLLRVQPSLIPRVSWQLASRNQVLEEV